MLKFTKFAAIALIAPIMISSHAMAQDTVPTAPQAVTQAQPGTPESQELTPEQAKFIGDQFVQCAALYSASAQSYAATTSENPEEKAKIIETGNMLGMQAEIAAAMVYSMYRVDGVNTIEERVTAQKSNYVALINADSPQIKSDIQICSEMLPAQKQLVEMAMQLVEANQQPAQP